jgi:hypothetical protein
MSLFHITALAIWPIFFFFSFALFRASGFDYSKKSFSDLGGHKRFGIWFNVLLIFVGIVQFFVLIRFVRLFPLALTSLLITTVMGILEGMITKKINERIHFLIGVVGFTFSAIGWILLGVFLFQTRSVVALIIGLWGVAIMVWIPYASLHYCHGKNCPAKYEVLLFVGAFVTNIILSALYVL